MAPTSYYIYTTKAASSLYSYCRIASSRVRRIAAASGARSEASGRWGFLPLAAVALVGGCIGGAGAFATYAPGAWGEDMPLMEIADEDGDENEYKKFACKATEVSRRVILLPLDEDYSYPKSTSRGDLQLVHPILCLQGTARNSTSECIDVKGVSYKLQKLQIFKQLCRKLKFAIGKDGSDRCKKSMEALKNALVLVLVLVPLEFVSDFAFYVLEEGLRATGIDYLFGWMVFFVTGLLGWQLKGTPFWERFVIEQPEDHLAHLTLKLIKEGTEVTQLLKENIDMKQEVMDTVIAQHHARIMALEKALSQQSDLTKRLEDAVMKMEALMNGQKAEEPKEPDAAEKPVATKESEATHEPKACESS